MVRNFSKSLFHTALLANFDKTLFTKYEAFAYPLCLETHCMPVHADNKFQYRKTPV